MTQIDENSLLSLLSERINLREVEPDIVSVFPNNEVGNSYDNKFGTFHDLIACNPIYNRLIWGYSTAEFSKFTNKALTSSTNGNILDIGCGSLAFTAKTYDSYDKRPVILLDQSLKLLRMAKSRMAKLHGHVPKNIIFLHADAQQLPFKSESFTTVISLNLLHVLDDIKKILIGIKDVSSAKANFYFTTLITGNRLADKYMKVWVGAGELVARNIEELQTIFNGFDMPITYEINGNMAFIHCESN
ncbi:ubiquinone/menaquinone biosynthesis methyltransferase [bacterium BMS3Abin07]|nr:ubiquinone/menaquinone biosynthesis methyltransferase [bacterium BMS3Abin07]GBE31750.1 ubiquinone/menaquinone biosynthesis methyltransferase [bacterium BMS3Bbin05]